MCTYIVRTASILRKVEDCGKWVTSKVEDDSQSHFVSSYKEKFKFSKTADESSIIQQLKKGSSLHSKVYLAIHCYYSVAQ